MIKKNNSLINNFIYFSNMFDFFVFLYSFLGKIILKDVMVLDLYIYLITIFFHIF